MAPRVFYLSTASHDITDACRFGDLVAIYDGRSRPSVFDHSKFHQDLLTRLDVLGFDPAKDYFLNVGASVPLVLATAFILNQYRVLQALLFHAGEQQYVLRKLEITHAQE